MARKLKYNDEEGGMAKAQLQKIEMYAAKLNEMIHPEDELEGWVQNKLSVVAAYMGDVKHYLDYALQNEPEYKEFANGGMMDKPRYWEVEFTWDAANEESRKVNVMAESVSDAEEQVKKKFGPYYEGLKVVEVEEDKEMTWDEYEKRPKKFEIESTTDYDVIEADDEEEAKKEWLRRRKGDSYKSEIIGVRRKFSEGGLAENETFVKSAIESASGDKISKKVLPAEYDNSDSKMYCSIKNPKVIYYIGKENQIIKYDGVTGERYPIGDLRHYDGQYRPDDKKMADGGLTQDESDKLTKLQEEKDNLKMQELDISMGVKGGKKNWENKMRSINDEINTLLKKKYGWKMASGGMMGKGGTMADGGMVYDIEWKDEEGDTYEASFESLEEAKQEIRKITDDGGRIIQTWKYRDGEYVGRFDKGGETDDGEKWNTKFIKYAIESASGDKISHIEYDDFDEKIYWSKNYPDVTYFIREEKIFKYNGATGKTFEIGELKHYDTSYADGGMMKEKYFSVSWLNPKNGTQHKEFSSKEDAIKYVINLYKYEDYLEYANKEEIPRIYDENRKELMSGYELQSLAEKQINKMASGGTMRYEGSTEAEDFKEAEEYIGKDVWETLSKEDKLNATQYLKAKGVIGYAGQEEEIADFMASQYAKGGSLYRGMRPSPSISATAYPRGFKMIGNDGNMWEISLDSRGVHRWTKSSSATRNDRTEQKAKIREAIELLESMRDEIDVEDEIATLKKLQ